MQKRTTAKQRSDGDRTTSELKQSRAINYEVRYTVISSSAAAAMSLVLLVAGEAECVVGKPGNGS